MVCIFFERTGPNLRLEEVTPTPRRICREKSCMTSHNDGVVRMLTTMSFKRVLASSKSEHSSYACRRFTIMILDSWCFYLKEMRW